MGKSERRARKRARRNTNIILVRCDNCAHIQPLTTGHGLHPSGCSGCSHIYGTYAEPA